MATNLTNQSAGAAVRAVAVAVATLGGTAFGPPAHGVWIVTPTVSIESRYDDNVRLTPGNEEDGILTVATAQAGIRNLTERSQISAYAGVNYVWYSGIDNLEDKDSEFVDFIASRRYERSSLGLRGSYKRDTLMRSLRFVPDALGGGEPPEEDEQQDDLDDVNDTPDVDAGQVREQIRRTRIGVSPFVTYRFSERTSGTLNYSYLKLDFDDQGPASGVDGSETHAVGTTLKHRLSEVDTLTGNVRVSSFEPNSKSDADNVEVRFGWKRRFSERTTGSAEIGARQVEVDTEDETGMLYRGRVDHNFGRGALSATAERSLYPSSFGEIVDTDRLGIEYRQGLSPRWAMSFDARALSTRSAAGPDSKRNRDYAQGGASLTFALAPEVLVGLNYGYRWVERDADQQSASGNSISLSLSYQPGSQTR